MATQVGKLVSQMRSLRQGPVVLLVSGSVARHRPRRLPTRGAFGVARLRHQPFSLRRLGGLGMGTKRRRKTKARPTRRAPLRRHRCRWCYRWERQYRFCRAVKTCGKAQWYFHCLEKWQAGAPHEVVLRTSGLSLDLMSPTYRAYAQTIGPEARDREAQRLGEWWDRWQKADSGFGHLIRSDGNGS